jgi:F0F1-type ATP synthase epsilon subunit
MVKQRQKKRPNWIKRLFKIEDDTMNVRVSNTYDSDSSWEDVEYLFDFSLNWNEHRNSGQITNGIYWRHANRISNSTNDNYVMSIEDNEGINNLIVNAPVVKIGEKQVPVTTKTAIRPKDVIAELEEPPRPFDLRLLDEKIKMLTDKAALVEQKYAHRQITELAARLENRKKWMEHREFFTQFQTTTEGKIVALCEKYGFVKKTSDLFVPVFPDEAVKIMTAYTEKVKAITGGKKPVFYVVAESKDFKKAEEKLDPILLAQSPFGFYYDVLGAWAEELLVLDEL